MNIVKPPIIIGASLIVLVAIITTAVALFTAGKPSSQVITSTTQSGNGIPGVQEVTASYSPDPACEALCKKYSVVAKIDNSLSEDGSSRLLQEIARANAKVTKPMQLCFRYAFKSPDIDGDLEADHARRIFKANNIDSGGNSRCAYLVYDKGRSALVARDTPKEPAVKESCDSRDPCSLESNLLAQPWIAAVSTGGAYDEVIVRITSKTDSVSADQLKSAIQVIHPYVQQKASSPTAYVVVRKYSNPHERIPLAKTSVAIGLNDTLDDGTVLKFKSFGLTQKIGL